ncbi:MAG: hypothetical protein M3N47_13835 [Chloroflexota bacterium]|nr:hypothetical protein [Chloroflexota bacterium]
MPKRLLGSCVRHLGEFKAGEPDGIGFPPDELVSHEDPRPQPDGDAVFMDKRNGW